MTYVNRKYTETQNKMIQRILFVSLKWFFLVSILFVLNTHNLKRKIEIRGMKIEGVEQVPRISQITQVCKANYRILV
jgi:hypothetical protein